MNYNIDFEICSLAYLLIVIGYFFLKRKYINLQGKIYAFYVLFIFFNIVTNIISVYLINSAKDVPIVLNYIVNGIYMCCQLVIPTILLLYILSFTNLMKKSTILLFSIPVVLGICMVFTNPFTHFYFYFNNAFEYVRGFGHVYLYFNGVIYVLFSFIIIVKYRKRLGASLFYTFIAIITILVGGMLFQLYHPDLLITGTGAVISQLMLYLAMENPDIYSDTLTSALNEQAIKSKAKGIYEQGSSANLVLVSMQDFKMINEIFGRTLGDLMLKRVADFLITLTNKQTVFRINGDVFIILMKDVEASYDLMGKIKERFKSEWEANHMSVRLSAMLALMDTSHYKNSEELIAMLEQTMIEMKKKDGKSIYVVDSTEKDKLERNATIKRAIADIIKNNRIEMFYQPIYYANGKLRALESLARMNLVKYGYVPPEEFIRMAEVNGSILQLGDVVINEVLDFVVENKEYFDKGLLIGINLSVIQIMKPKFAEKLLAVLDEKQVKPECVVFEVTESEAIYSDSTVVENLNVLKEAGIRFSMDDYGTGYANINNIVEIPFSTIKIDKQVIWNSMRNRRARVILVNTVRMLQDLNFEIIAEGIENKEQLEMMKHLSIDMFQGYYYTKPLASYEIWDEIEKINHRMQIESKIV